MNPAPAPATDLSSTNQDDAWLDEVLKETFPASDPVPWRHRDRELPDVERTSSDA